jgi:hypothetical protein
MQFSFTFTKSQYKFLFRYIFLLLTIVLSKTITAQSISGLFINEFIASNSATLVDETGNYEDWIEIYNSGSNDVNLAGFYITDDLRNPKKYLLPHGSSETIIPAGGFIVIWASGDPSRGILHTNFKLSISGEQIGLYAPDGITPIDSLSFGRQFTDISFGRDPDGGEFFLFYSEPTPGFSNSNSEGYSSILDPPVFSHPAGFYESAFNLSITHNDPTTTIIYTLDGSVPDTTNLQGKTYYYKNQYSVNPGDPFGDTLIASFRSFVYNDSIRIEDRTSENNYLSHFSSTVQHPTYFPVNSIKKGTVVRAMAIKPGSISRSIATHTYFVSQENAFQSDLPIISLAIQEDELFAYEYGIYTAGEDNDQWRLANPSASSPHPEARPANFRRESEYPLNIEYFENKHSVINQLAGFRIHGGWSRGFRIKSLRLYARNQYEDSSFNYSFFSDLSCNAYKTLILRNSGNDHRSTYIRDAAIHNFVKHLNFSTQAYLPSIVFINGEYLGIHNIRERIDKHYISRHFQVNSDEIDLITVNFPEEGDLENYNGILNYISNNDISDSAHYAYLLSKIDIKSFIDYQITQIYIRNDDWPANNYRFWRSRADNFPQVSGGNDGRWRWILYDTDAGFGLSGGTNAYAHNTLEMATDSVGAPFPNPPWSTFLLRNFLKNESFQNKFINRFADLINTTFFPDRLITIIDSLSQRINSEFPEHLNRWRLNSMNGWNNSLNTMKNFAIERPYFVREHIKSKFDLNNTQGITVDLSINNAGYIKINTIEILPSTPGVPENPYPWSGIYFEDVPVSLTAYANPGFLFSHWDIEGTEFNTSTIQLNLKKSTYALAVFQIDSIMLPHLELIVNQPNCKGSADGSITAYISGGEAPYFYQWSTGFDSIVQNISALWDFNNLVPSLSPNTTSGKGDAILIGGTSNPESNFNGNGSSDTASVNNAWQTSGYPSQGINPKTAGVQFNINTSGYGDIAFSFDQRISNSAANTWVLQYSANVNTSQPIWKDASTFTFTPEPSGTGDAWYNNRSFDFSSIKELNNNPDVGFRIVSDFAPGTGQYLAARSTSAYNGGTSRFDMITVRGNPIVILSLLEAGDYSITVKDRNGLTITETVSVSEPELVSALVVTTEAPCYFDGTASVEISGGVPPYIINWNTGDTTQQVVLPVGNYLFEVTDSNHCVLTDSVFILGNTNPIQLEYNITPCNAETGGSIELIINGGSYPYTIHWNTGDTTSNIFGLQEGSYFLTVTDGNNCQISDTVNLTKEQSIVDFQYQTNHLQISLFNNSSSGSYHWDFGDGNYSLLTNPVHVYSAEGLYFICLTVKALCDTVSHCESVTIQSSSIIGMTSQDKIQIFPNPAHNVLNVKFNVDNVKIIKLDLLNSLGKVLKTEFVDGDFMQLNLSLFSRGIYFLRTLDENGIYTIHRFSLIND